MTHRDWALRYAARGWRVYPVARGEKRALFSGWQASATTDAELIERQWRREPYPNVGLICGESFAVFDIEAPHLPLLFEYGSARGDVLPETPVAQSGRGGVHIYVRPVSASRRPGSSGSTASTSASSKRRAASSPLPAAQTGSTAGCGGRATTPWRKRPRGYGN